MRRSLIFEKKTKGCEKVTTEKRGKETKAKQPNTEVKDTEPGLSCTCEGINKAVGAILEW